MEERHASVGRVSPYLSSARSREERPDWTLPLRFLRKGIGGNRRGRGQSRGTEGNPFPARNDELSSHGIVLARWALCFFLMVTRRSFVETDLPRVMNTLLVRRAFATKHEAIYRSTKAERLELIIATRADLARSFEATRRKRRQAGESKCPT